MPFEASPELMAALARFDAAEDKALSAQYCPVVATEQHLYEEKASEMGISIAEAHRRYTVLWDVATRGDANGDRIYMDWSNPRIIEVPCYDD